MASVLILGGTGFVGKSILESFQLKKLNKYKIDKIIIISRGVSAFKKNYPYLLSPRVKLLKKNLLKINQLPYADYIIHAAASSDEKNYTHNNFKKNENIKITQNLLKVLKNKKFLNSKFVYLSSGAVYGNIFSKSQTKEKFFSSHEHLNKLSNNKKRYAESKIISENMIRNFRLNSKINCIFIFRLFSFIGQFIPRNKHFLIGNILDGLLKKKKIKIKSRNPINIIRSYMFSDDMVDLVFKVTIKKHNKKINCYNIGSSEAHTIKDIEKIISKNRLSNFVYPFFKKSDKNLDFYVPNIDKLNKKVKKIRIISLKKSIELSLSRIKLNEK